MNILDQILEAGQPQPEVNQALALQMGEMRDEAAQTFGPQSSDLYRGFANRVGTYSSVQDILDQTKLNWKVCEMPVLVQGKTQNKVFEGKKALVRCDNGDMIEITSDTFKVHQNIEMVGAMLKAVEGVDAKVSKGGYFPESGKVFLEARLENKFSTTGAPSYAGHSFKKGAQAVDGSRVGDTLALDIVLTGGHKPGTPFKLKGIAKRLACSNGATIMEAFNLIRLTHRQGMNMVDNDKLEKFHRDVVMSFNQYCEGYKLLTMLEATTAMQQAFILDVIGEENLVARAINRPALNGAALIAELVETDERKRAINGGWFLEAITDMKRKDTSIEVPRIFNRIEEVLNVQPGGNLTEGTLANAYNATTYYVDHLRGRNGSAAVESALDGDGDRLKRTAMVEGQKWVSALVGQA
jgi:hypothetical protein